MPNRWVYLTDLIPTGTIMNLESRETRQIMSSGIKDRAPAGLRRYVLEEREGGAKFQETGEILPITVDLLDDLEDSYSLANSWIADWPHYHVEHVGDADRDMEERVRQRLTRMMGDYPYDFQITGLQRRYLMYFSDGDYNSQKKFERLIPVPKSSPFRSDGALRRRYDWIWNSNMRDAQVPFPKSQRLQYGALSPCLYLGPAWVVRFTLDGVDVLLDRCRVYVDDDANFICSDWCQRHDYSSYNSGINLQQGIYTFDSWVNGPCITRNKEAGNFDAPVKRTQIRSIMHKAQPVVTRSFEQSYAAAAENVKKYAKPILVTPPPTPDAGPITPEAMAEAFALSEGIWAAREPELVEGDEVTDMTEALATSRGASEPPVWSESPEDDAS
jgi:hypothetical protein